MPEVKGVLYGIIEFAQASSSPIIDGLGKELI